MNGRVDVTLAWDCGGCVTELGSKHHPAIDDKSRDDDTPSRRVTAAWCS
jgi:hypothetical protein